MRNFHNPALALLLAVGLLLAGCAREELPPALSSEQTDRPEPVTTLSPQSTADPLTEPPETLPAVVLPDPAEGVWFAQSASELAAIDFGDFSGIPTICITQAFEMTGLTIFDRPIRLYYTASETITQPVGTGILIETRQEGQITVESLSPHLLSSGLLTIDAPFCTLSWSGEGEPEAEDLRLWCNVRSEAADLGGQGSAVITDLALLSSETGRPYEDGAFSVRGNVITLGYPLLAGDEDVHAASLLCTTTGKIEARKYDLRVENLLTVTDAQGIARTYLLRAERLSYQLPVVQIYTQNGEEITSKSEYLDAEMLVNGEPYSLRIRGRGNASWTMFPKKAYRIKLDDSARLFGLPKNRDFVLVSNYADKSLIRNSVASAIASELDGLEFTPTHVSVHLYLNGEYRGIYGFAEKIEEGNGKLDLSEKKDDTASAFEPDPQIGDIGFLCEVGWDFEGENVHNRDWFDTEKVLRIYVKDPDIYVRNQAELVYVREYLYEMERAIAQDNGWLDYIDLDSWVDWFLATELTFNTESVFYRSCYFWKRAGGKLMLGPVWDADMAFGNHMGDIDRYHGFCTTESTYYEIEENWIDDLIEYPVFQEAVKQRWNEVKERLLAAGLAEINRASAELAGSVEQNFKVWDILDKQIGLGAVDPKEYDTYEKQVQYLRDFLTERYAYLDERINAEF